MASFVPPGKVVADIGADHAYLSVYLAQTGRSPKVIATELSEEPWRRACFWVSAYHLENQIEVRRGKGLGALFPGEAQVVVIAGLGGNTIIKILAAAPAVLRRLERLILQPMTDAGDLRLWLVDNGWRLVEETLVEEEGRLYEIVVAEQGEEVTRDRLLLELGPRLIEKGNPLSVSYLERRKENYQRVLSSLARSRSPEAQEKAILLTAKLTKVKELLRNRLSEKKHKITAEKMEN